jgi:hypothetical protein
MTMTMLIAKTDEEDQHRMLLGELPLGMSEEYVN